MGSPAVERDEDLDLGAAAPSAQHWLGTDNYDFTKPILPQLDAIKKKVEGFVRLNQKHGTTLMYHTRAGANSVVSE